LPQKEASILNPEAKQISHLNAQLAELLNNDFSAMNNDQFHSNMNQLLALYQQRQAAIQTFQADYSKNNKYITSFSNFLSPAALNCYQAQFNAWVPIIQAQSNFNIDSLTRQQKENYYQNTFEEPAAKAEYQPCMSL